MKHYTMTKAEARAWDACLHLDGRRPSMDDRLTVEEVLMQAGDLPIHYPGGDPWLGQAAGEPPDLWGDA